MESGREEGRRIDTPGEFTIVRQAVHSDDVAEQGGRGGGRSGKRERERNFVY